MELLSADTNHSCDLILDFYYLHLNSHTNTPMHCSLLILKTFTLHSSYCVDSLTYQHLTALNDWHIYMELLQADALKMV